MGITKIATKKNIAQRQWTYTNSAREAWSNILDILKKENPQYKILLPAYIGWSPNEGSGIFDSVKNSSLDFDFYNLDRNLKIDFDHFKNKIKETKSCIVLLVHYFGFPDVQYQKIINWLDQNNILYIEDCAHSWLTDLIGGKCGRNGRFAFYSLHKMLPVSGGGIMVDNKPDIDNKSETFQPHFDLGYDLFTIYRKRRENYTYLVEKLKGIPNIDIIHTDLEDGICPQTLPVVIRNYDRNKLYQEMNDFEIGMVSLYHTMIDELKNSTSEAANFTSKHIINFPVHQDIVFGELDNLMVKLKAILNV
ncbi:DegT/DnrJ/EryC1/StrS family aminotransferase [Sphingobacterium spiritivorum]|uniref:DegT/DnrJ/EryC1/StrS aminotransferase family protein n=1 Tax=Sphingobacterium spiritivorum ATCC 33861 TaxID=525373 RepID=D7VI72_SPHSI|nr:DegT/DnrJ/EryC1/StrS family aminotransferase [Sphingobacterium spiritivorum]EFK59774.1 hypothetical protein HMPREF0766_10691 [Sphingobacterium spiritivorum ATCC 33861]QQT37581.1 DegT/DnrJ/EryC1/StrS aminotransferase family protein [Sphingobacterium spiritivorum]WQD34378.1 DegT/DnrJ/EryC1/StrS family aminotransferase [Sphingobacterium spiritivorum]SUI97318.1 TDP-4-oxo-6-deoxy-D-glucose transaminase [Sphingobacterium spiritivorum]